MREWGGISKAYNRFVWFGSLCFLFMLLWGLFKYIAWSAKMEAERGRIKRAHYQEWRSRL